MSSAATALPRHVLARLRHGPRRSFRRSETLTAAVIAAVAATLIAALVPPGGDAPAHLYRILLTRSDVLVWDNLWYGGHYPLASYSLLYYLPASLVGNLPLVVAASIASAALFAAIVTRQFGEAARWPTRLFAPLAAFPLVSGTYSYALGFAFVLLALRALQAGRPWLMAACAAVALAFSSLAFLFLVVVLAGVVVAHRRFDRRAVAVGAALALPAGIQVASLALFSDRGVYPFEGRELVGVVAVGIVGAALARHNPRARLLGAFFAVWTLTSLMLFFVPTPVGDNITRLGILAFPLMLLTAHLTRLRPRWLTAAALATALVYTAGPVVGSAASALERGPNQAAFWRPALTFLERYRDPNYRVAVVPTAGHWEAYWLPRAGFALARGWYRQLDVARNPQLYRTRLAPDAYRDWLRSAGVRYVLLMRARPGPMGGAREAELLRSGRSGLVVAARGRNWTAYELPRPTPILTGPARASLITLGRERLVGSVAAPGRYLLRVRYMPYWRILRGNVCLARAQDGMTLLHARSRGAFALVPVDVSAILVATVRPPGAACERA